MHRFRYALAAFFIFLAGGCPVATGPATLGNAGGGTDPPLGAGGGTVAGNGLSFSDWLTTQFPGCNEPHQADAWRARILELVNEERARAGVPPVVHNQTLADQAAQYACEMIVYRFFDHVNPVTGTTLSDRADEFGYDFLVIGENLAGGQPTPEQAMLGWMNSPGHRANILDARFTELGVGVRTGGEFGIYWVQEFGRPLPTNGFRGDGNIVIVGPTLPGIGLP